MPRGRLEIIALWTPGERRIDGSQLPIGDADFARLAPMRRLTNFESKWSTGTGAGFAFLAGSPDLTRVMLQGSALTEAAPEPLLGLRKLDVLILNSEKPLAWTLLGELSALPNLTTLNTNHAQSISPAVLARRASWRG